jgi:hypothetical protein
MHTALIFKEQEKVKETGFREKGLAKPHYSIQHNEGYDLLCYKVKATNQSATSIQDLFCNTW